MWGQIAAITLPYVLSAMQDKPDRPEYRPPSGGQLPDRSGYLDEILQEGFSPQTELYEQATDVISDKIARQMGRRGLGSSSFASSAQSAALSDLANKYLENELKRKMDAVNTVTGYDMNKQRLAQNAYDAAYQAQMGDYKDQMDRQAAVTQGVAGMAQAGLGLYQRQQMANQRQQNYDDLIAAMQSPSSGQSQASYVPYGGYYPTPGG